MDTENGATTDSAARYWRELCAVKRPCPCPAIVGRHYEDSEDAEAAGGCLVCYDNGEHQDDCANCAVAGYGRRSANMGCFSFQASNAATTG